MATHVVARIRSRYRVLLLGLGIGLLGLPLVAAQAGSIAPQDITLSPAQQELSAPPGGTTQGSMMVVNGGSTAFDIKVYADPYHVVGVGYNPSFNLIPGATDPSTWVHFSAATTAQVAPSQAVSIPYSLEVPAGTAPGGYYAVLFAETQPPPETGVSSHSRVGDILYITVQGPVKQSGSIQATPTSHFVFGSNVPLATEVSNTGGLHFITTAHLVLANLLTNKAAFSASLQRYVLPQTVRKITTIAGPTAPLGLYKVEASADILGQTQTLPDQWVVVIHPWALLIIPIIVILIVIYLRLPKKKSRTNGKRR